MRDDFAAGIEFVDALGKIAKRNEMSLDIADMVFVRLAHIKHKQVVAGIQTAFEFLYLHFRYACFHGLLLATNSAKLLIVYQLRNGGMSAAGRALGILA